MIILPPSLLRRIVDLAEAAYPEECCGLLIGRFRAPDRIAVSHIAESPNVTKGDPRRNFEVDPQIRFDTERGLRGKPEHIIGFYHSHPDHRAQPSLTDLCRVFENDMVWLITSVIDAQAVLTTAHVPDADGRQFRPIPLRTDDWKAYDRRWRDGDRDGDGNEGAPGQ